MPILQNAKKALRQSIRRGKRNKTVLDEIDSLRRHFKVSLKEKKVDEAKKLVQAFSKKMDKAVSKKILKANTVARLKSRAILAVNKLGK
ncbi:MAG: 30S ribosomal protein S20 [Patescibacteria group bacterium]